MRPKDIANLAALSGFTSFERIRSQARDTGDLGNVYQPTYTTSTSGHKYVWYRFSKRGSAPCSIRNLQRPTSPEIAANWSSLSKSLDVRRKRKDRQGKTENAKV